MNGKRRLGSAWIVAITAVLVGWAEPAARADGRARIAVAPFSGPHADGLRRLVARELKRSGARVTAQALPDDPVEVSREDGVSAFVTGRVRRAGRRWQFVLEIINGADGRTLLQTRWRARRAARLAPLVRRQLKSRLSAPLREVRPAAVEREPARPPVALAQPESTPQRDVPSREASASRWGSRSPRRWESRQRKVADPSPAASAPTVTRRVDAGDASRPIRLEVGMRVYQRSLNYNDDLFARMPSYRVEATPSATAAAEYFALPYAGVAASVALTNQFESATNAESGGSFPTSGYAYAVGVRARWTLATFALDYGAHKFAIEDAADGESKPAIPSVSYQYLRAGAGTELALARRLAVGASLGYRYLMESGEIGGEGYFPRASAAGVDASAWVTYQLMDRVYLRAGLDLERYFFSLNPLPGDPFVAGGAVDQYLGASLGAGLRL